MKTILSPAGGGPGDVAKRTFGSLALHHCEPILLNNLALFTNDTLSGPIGWKVLVRPSIPFARRGWIQLFVSNSRNQNILSNPSRITACATKVVIVINKVKLLNSNINVTKITPYVKVTL